MLSTAKKLFTELVTTIVRVVLIFLVLSIGFDSMTRLYYSYMPVSTWMEFQSVDVIEGTKDIEPYVLVKRQPTGTSISVFHRTLLIRYPDERRGCTNSTVTIIDDPSTDHVIVPLDRMLSDNCPAVLGKNPTNAVLQVSYIFEFPFGVKRVVTRFSPKFSIFYDGSVYHIGKPMSDDELSAMGTVR